MISIALAGFAPAVLLRSVFIISGILSVTGVLCCLATAFVYSKTITNPILQASIIQKPHFKNKQVGFLWLGQAALIALSFVLFHFLETQTQIETRLSPVETGYIMNTLQQQPFSLGLFPFVIYSALGVGLAYFSVCVGEKPFLVRIFSTRKFEKSTTQFILFWRNFLFSVTDLVIFAPFVFVSSFALFWLCEGVNAYFGLESLFRVPLRTIFILGFLIFIFQRINKQLIQWMTQQNISVAQLLIIYILTFGLFLSFLHGSSDWLTLPIEVPVELSKKSYFAGVFSEQSLQIRIQYLIWGWWGIWIPWMSSWIARSSIGFSIVRALIQALILPAMLFGFGIQMMSNAKWMVIYQWLQMPSIQLLVAIGLFLWIWTLGSETRTIGDVLRGAMLPLGRISKRPLTRWMTILMLWITCYVSGSFILGWLFMQFIVTVGGLFMIGVVLILIGRWGASLYRSWALKKYKAAAVL